MCACGRPFVHWPSGSLSRNLAQCLECESFRVSLGNQIIRSLSGGAHSFSDARPAAAVMASPDSGEMRSDMLLNFSTRRDHEKNSTVPPSVLHHALHQAYIKVGVVVPPLPLGQLRRMRIRTGV